MKRRYVLGLEAAIAGGPRPLSVLYLAGDAALFLATVYLAVRAHLLLRDGVIGGGQAFVWLAASALVICALAVRATRRASSSLAGLALELAGVALFVFLPGLASDVPPNEETGMSFLWLALEWSRLPENLVLLARLSPVATALHVVAALLLARVAASRVPRRAHALLPISVVIAFAVLLAGIAAQERILVYVVVYLFPWCACALGFALLRPRMAARAGALGCATSLLLVHYVGVIPTGSVDFDQAPGVRRIYPATVGTEEIPLAFLRDFQVDAERGVLYTAYGPTSGFLGLDLESGQLDRVETPDGLVRHFWTEPGLDHLYALDWVYMDLLEIQKEPLAIRERFDLAESPRIVPMSFLMGSQHLAVAYTELPGVAVFDRATRRLLESLSFRDLGITRFRSGAWNLVGDVDAGFAVIQVGAVDARSGYRLVRLGFEPLRVTHEVAVPDGGLAILWIPERNAVLTAGFFTDRIFEFDASTLELRREIRGPLNCRRLVYDPARDLVLATAFLPGELWAMPFEEGVMRRLDRVGNKSLSMELVTEEDRLYLGSQAGIFEIDLATYLGDRCPDCTPQPVPPGQMSGGKRMVR